MKYEYRKGEINKVIRVISQEENNKYNYIVSCPRCGGTGTLDIFKHVQEGDCFKCGRSGEIERQGKLYTLEEAEKLQTRYKLKKEKEWALIMEKQENEKIEYEKMLKDRKEKAKQEREIYLEEKKKKKRKTRKEIINEMLISKDEDLRYYIGNMTEDQVKAYIKGLKDGSIIGARGENMEIKGSIRRSIIAHFEENEDILSML